MRILLVSAPHADATWLLKAFQESAYSVQSVEALRDGLFMAAEESFDVVVVLAAQPGLPDGWLDAFPDFLALPHRPRLIAMVRGVGASARVSLLRAGADMCLTHPWSFIEIHERIQGRQRALLARREGDHHPVMNTLRDMPQASAVSDLSRYSLDAATRELVSDAARLALTSREFRLLECLFRQPNVPVSRDLLIRYAWSEKDDVDPASVNLVVSRLRRKLADGFQWLQIETVNRFGYQLLCTG